MSTHPLVNPTQQIYVENFRFPLEKGNAHDANFIEIELVQDLIEALLDIVHRDFLVPDDCLIEHCFNEHTWR